CQRTASYIFNAELFTGYLKEDAKDAGKQVREHLLEVIREKRAAVGRASNCTVVDRLIKTGSADAELCTVLGGTLSGLFVAATSQFLKAMDRLLDLPARDLDAVRALAVEHQNHDHTAAPASNLLERHVLEAARFSPFPPGLVRYCADGAVLETGKGKQV